MKWVAVAAASSVVLTVGMVLSGIMSPVPEQTVPATRISSPALSAPWILSPRGGSELERGALELEWTPIAGALYYDVYIISKSGDLVKRVRVDSTRWAPGTDSAIKPGTEYYIRVDAYLADSRTLSSGHVLFNLTGTD